MLAKAISTKNKIVCVTVDLLAKSTVRALSLDAVAEAAGISKKCLYNYFPSKDHLVTAALDVLLQAYQRDFETMAETGNFPSVREFVLARIDTLAKNVNDPHWRGTLFMRISAELGNLPGHPAHAIFARATAQAEAWFERRLLAEGHPNAKALARQIIIVRGGSVLAQMQEPSADYAEAAKDMINRLLAAQPALRAVA